MSLITRMRTLKMTSLLEAIITKLMGPIWYKSRGVSPEHRTCIAPTILRFSRKQFNRRLLHHRRRMLYKRPQNIVQFKFDFVDLVVYIVVDASSFGACMSSVPASGFPMFALVCIAL